MQPVIAIQIASNTKIILCTVFAPLHKDFFQPVHENVLNLPSTISNGKRADLFRWQTGTRTIRVVRNLRLKWGCQHLRQYNCRPLRWVD